MTETRLLNPTTIVIDFGEHTLTRIWDELDTLDSTSTVTCQWQDVTLSMPVWQWRRFQSQQPMIFVSDPSRVGEVERTPRAKRRWWRP